MDVDHKSEMEDILILNKAWLSELLQRFVAEKVESETIGGCDKWWQGELREACRKRKKEPHQNDARGSGAAFEYEDTFSARNSERRLLF